MKLRQVVSPQGWEDSAEGYPQTPPFAGWRLHDEYGKAT
jgi:hypothetical protein